MPFLSVVVPSLRDEVRVAALMAQLAGDPRLEIVVSEPPPHGRGAQMNAGARRASGQWLLFLHADSQLPAGWIEALHDAVTRHEVLGGWFRFRLDSSAWQARLIERLVAVRVRLFRLPYGDQGIFVRRDVFERMGGYREWPLMEDVEFVRRLQEAGPVAELPLPLTTSPRRYERDGWLRRSLRNLGLVSLYFLGVSPERLARWYSRP